MSNVAGQVNANVQDLKQNLKNKQTEIKAEIQEAVKEVQVKSKKYIRSTLFACGSLFLLNGLLLYFGTLSGSSRIDLARFYGFREGKNEHLQRSVGILCIILAASNFLPLTKLHEGAANDALTSIAVQGNILAFTHYAVETIYFKDLRMEIIFCMGMFLLMNVFWTFKEMYQSKKEVIVVKKSQ
ncbi:A-kinase anchor protein [Acrasis kona]|uniref:A-kinase anchor protein n=1 Tax=Acrasis kona TaxID=1008807 RepID=A0AAW2ZHA5_9EUKA